MEPHALAEARSLAYHEAIARRLAAEPALVAGARRRVDAWEAAGLLHPTYAQAWRAALDGPREALEALLVDPGEAARALRQATPFAGALGPRERWAIWRTVRDEA